MATLSVERVVQVHHWNETLFSFSTTRDPSLRFENGQFLMLGLEIDGRPLLRAYSIASANHEEHLEFFSIKVEDGPLTSRLQHLKPGASVFISRKPTGSLLLRDLLPGKRLFLFSTGTGLAPFLSLVKDPEMYERFEKIVLVHGVRKANELAYEHYLTKVLPDHEFLGEDVRAKLVYYPTVTREPFRTRGRLTELVESNKLFRDLDIPALDPGTDRAMVCGSPSTLKDTCRLLDDRGFKISSNIGTAGDYVIERAFVEK
jgi:ferredoxin--NADP+ reductase